MYIQDIQSIYQTEINRSYSMQKVTISIRYIDFGQIIGFDLIFQSIIEYNCMKSLQPITARYSILEMDITAPRF